MTNALTLEKSSEQFDTDHLRIRGQAQPVRGQLTSGNGQAVHKPAYHEGTVDRYHGKRVVAYNPKVETLF